MARVIFLFIYKYGDSGWVTTIPLSAMWWRACREGLYSTRENLHVSAIAVCV